MTVLAHCVPETAAFPLAVSVLMMSDRLITLAQQADRAGYSATATRLLHLAHDVFDDKLAGDGRLVN